MRYDLVRVGVMQFVNLGRIMRKKLEWGKIAKYWRGGMLRYPNIFFGLEKILLINNYHHLYFIYI